MTKKIEKLNKQPSSLKGFEDIFEDYVESEEYKDNERREIADSKKLQQYELMNFIDQENARLSRLDIFLTKKVALSANFSQTEKLISQQLERKKNLSDKLTNDLKKKDSPLQQNLAIFFNTHFS